MSMLGSHPNIKSREKRTMHRMKILTRAILLLIIAIPLSAAFASRRQPIPITSSFNEQAPRELTIAAIQIDGLATVSSDDVYSKMPFRIGDVFKKRQVSSFIKKLYELGRFSSIKVTRSNPTQDTIALRITVAEKPVIEKTEFIGNNHLGENEIERKLKLSHTVALDAEQLDSIIQMIKKLYQDKDYHDVKITGELVPTTDNRVIVRYTIDEGERTIVRRVFIEGNKYIPSKALRKVLFTREVWLGSFFDRSGKYIPEAIEYDKYQLENFYQNSGFLAAHVTDVKLDRKESGYMDVTFVIDEGEPYTLESVDAEGNDLVPRERLLGFISLRPGMLWSREAVRNTMERLRSVWGEYGYIYADVQPTVVPNDEKKTIALSFKSDLGNKMMANRISIVGNEKTLDKVIRRFIEFNEGETLTTRAMDNSKTRVQGLGYFDQKEGVNWVTNKVDDEHVDLELNVKEIRTGHVNGGLSYGGTANHQSPVQSIAANVSVSDSNWQGSGVTYNFSGSLANRGEERTFMAQVGNPFLFDRPLFGNLQFILRRSLYDEMNNIVRNQTPVEHITGGAATIGFAIPRWGYMQCAFDGGAERIQFNSVPQAFVPAGVSPAIRANYQTVLNNRFLSGTIVRFGGSLMQEARNHPRFPSRGHRFAINAYAAVPQLSNNFGFAKFEFDGDWYTPLINENTLIFRIHGHFGIVENLNNQSIPYRELFHVGGPSNVRGFIFGQISPQVVIDQSNRLQGDSIGAKKAFWINVELIFPLTYDMGTRAVFFYDGGAGWDTPGAARISPEILRNNQFSYRHSFGFGLRLTSPTPIRLDWGFKLDRRKKRGEPLTKFHFDMSQEF